MLIKLPFFKTFSHVGRMRPVRLAPFDTPLYTVGGLILWIIFSLIVIPLTLFGSVSRLIVVICAKLFQPKLIPTSYKDAFFAALYACESSPLMSVGTSLRVSGHLETEAIMKRFQECFLGEDSYERYGNLYCYFQLYMGYVFKRRVDQLVLKNHFLENTLPRGTDPESYISKWLVSNTYQNNKPEGQPCWQVLILRKLPEEEGGQEETIVSIKMHHGMIDGYSIVHMIDKLTGSKSPYIVATPKKENLFTKIRHILEAPALALDVFVRLKPWNSQLTKQGDPFQQDWAMSLSTLDILPLVKDIRKKTQAKFATIMMSAVTGALKRIYMQEKGVTYDELPERMWMESPLGLPDHPSMTKGGKFCNHFTAGIYGMPLRTEDRMYRLESLERDFHSFAAHSGMETMTWVVYMGYWFQPAWLVRNFYTNQLSFLWRFSVLYSGLIASPKKIQLVGHTVENVYFLQATATSFPFVSLFLMCSTYNGKLDISCLATKELGKNKADLERFIQFYLKTELEAMHAEYHRADVEKPAVLEIEANLLPDKPDKDELICIPL